jgi:hypothetical protein
LKFYHPVAILPLALLGLVLCAAAQASCPEIEGRYAYTCTVEKDQDSEFGDVLEVSGSMLVQQTGCETYHFQDEATRVADEFLLNDPTGAVEGKIKKSNSDMIRFKTIERRSGIQSFVTKGLIRKQKNGFKLEGMERSRVLAIFGKKHTRFNCDFDVAN